MNLQEIGFIPEMRACFTTQKPINAVHTLNSKEKPYNPLKEHKNGTSQNSKPLKNFEQKTNRKPLNGAKTQYSTFKSLLPKSDGLLKSPWEGYCKIRIYKLHSLRSSVIRISWRSWFFILIHSVLRGGSSPSNGDNSGDSQCPEVSRAINNIQFTAVMAAAALVSN